jgi:hypothetical protein
MNSEPTPIASPGPSLGGPAISGAYEASPSIQPIPANSYQSEPVISYGSGDPGTIQSGPVYGDSYVSEYPVESAPVMSAPLSTYSDAPYASVGGGGCACQSNATVYSGGSLGLPAGDFGGYAGSAVGYQAMGYHGGGMETYTGAVGGGMHVRHPYYSYRRPWYANGPMSHNVNIAW